MPAPYPGGCICGEVRYVLESEPLTLYACHCTDCQKRTGTAFALSLIAARSAVKLLRGNPPLNVVKMADGRVSQSRACPSCGGRLWGEPVKFPDMAVVRPGTLDDTSWLRPVAHIWTRSAQPWFPFPQDVPKFEMQPAPGELAKLWQQRSALLHGQ